MVGGGGHSHRCCVQNSDWDQNAVKLMVKALLGDRSDGQAVSGVLGPISSIPRWPRGVVKILCMCNWSVVNGSRAKTRRGQGHF